MIAKDGRVVWVRDEATLIADEQGEPSYWQGFMLDITERKEADEKLRAAEQRYRSLVENIPVVVYMESTDRSFVDFFISPQLKSVLGWTPEEWESTDDYWYEHIHPDDLPAVLEEDRRTDETAEPFEFNGLVNRLGHAFASGDRGALYRYPNPRTVSIGSASVASRSLRRR